MLSVRSLSGGHILLFDHTFQRMCSQTPSLGPVLVIWKSKTARLKKHRDKLEKRGRDDDDFVVN
jgi:hypothetical protein